MVTKSIDNPINYIISTLAIENLSPSQDALELCRKLTASELTAEEAENAVFEKYGLKRITRNA